MSKFQCSANLADKLGIRHDWTAGKSADRVASAAGMPGFGSKFSAEALALVEAGTHSLHQAFLGRR